MNTMRIFILLALAAVLFGCASERHVTDVRHPEVSVTPFGSLTFREKVIDPDDLPDALDSAGYTAEDTISILVPADISDYRLPYYVMGVLSKNGYRRPVLVKERKVYSVTGEGARDAATPGARTVDGKLMKQTPGTQVVYPPKRNQMIRRR